MRYLRIALFVITLGFLIAICLTGCELLEWSVKSPNGPPPAVAALPEAVSAGLQALLTGGAVMGVLGFFGTYGKTLRRFWIDHEIKNKT